MRHRGGGGGVERATGQHMARGQTYNMQCKKASDITPGQRPLRTWSRGIICFCFLMILLRGSRLKNNLQTFYPPFHGLLLHCSCKHLTNNIKAFVQKTRIKFYSHMYKVAEFLHWIWSFSGSKPVCHWLYKMICF